MRNQPFRPFPCRFFDNAAFTTKISITQITTCVYRECVMICWNSSKAQNWIKDKNTTNYHVVSLPFGTPSAREKQFSQYSWSRCSEIYVIDANINGYLNVIPRFLNNFLKTFISPMKHRKSKVCLRFWAILSLTGCRSNCFTFLTGGYAFIRLVGVYKSFADCLLSVPLV